MMKLTLIPIHNSNIPGKKSSTSKQLLNNYRNRLAQTSSSTCFYLHTRCIFIIPIPGTCRRSVPYLGVDIYCVTTVENFLVQYIYNYTCIVTLTPSSATTSIRREQIDSSLPQNQWRHQYNVIKFGCKSTRISTLGPAYNEFGYNENLLTTSRFLHIKIIDINVRLLQNSPRTSSFLCIYLFVLSGTQCRFLFTIFTDYNIKKFGYNE